MKNVVPKKITTVNNQEVIAYSGKVGLVLITSSTDIEML